MRAVTLSVDRARREKIPLAASAAIRRGRNCGKIRQINGPWLPKSRKLSHTINLVRDKPAGLTRNRAAQCLSADFWRGRRASQAVAFLPTTYRGGFYAHRNREVVQPVQRLWLHPHGQRI